jgi:hypothetical protein
MDFEKFYTQVYLARHRGMLCRLLHFFGLAVAVAMFAVIAWYEEWWYLPLLPVPVYAFGWLGHLWDREQPTTWQHPYWSFLAYFRMVASVLIPKQWWAEETAQG